MVLKNLKKVVFGTLIAARVLYCQYWLLGWFLKASSFSTESSDVNGHEIEGRGLARHRQAQRYLLFA